MSEYFVLNNKYDKKDDNIILFNNEDYKFSFLNTIKGGSEDYIEIDKEVLKNLLTEEQLENLERVLYDKKLKALFPTKHDIRINSKGKIEISIKPKNNISIKKDLFI